MLWREIWISYGGRISGLVVAIVLGILYLTVGFWDMLFVGLLLWIGYTIGRMKDDQSGPIIPWSRWTEWLMQRWRPFK
ncbi:DUF2273 domain-containing protein [Paenibacillus nasutitermitis]|uniref:DUF2273 domain-containing protein n=1 Tax=Paenibacillus nasutitermitis TaxID=1652958 RepID=A0A916Z094_9BACL|nr:DUF2273 domain-containing protein [Paenibacillus nasutitermitis]GGD70068.1 hypothetical protein GCM10010911_29930 [Paenibacillus nasutitermitis]